LEEKGLHLIKIPGFAAGEQNAFNAGLPYCPPFFLGLPFDLLLPEPLPVPEPEVPLPVVALPFVPLPLLPLPLVPEPLFMLPDEVPVSPWPMLPDWPALAWLDEVDLRWCFFVVFFLFVLVLVLFCVPF
jgi:hypothetical protein